MCCMCMGLDFLFDQRQDNCIMIIKLAQGTASKIKNASSSRKWIICNCCSACLNSNASTNSILYSLALFFFLSYLLLSTVPLVICFSAIDNTIEYIVAVQTRVLLGLLSTIFQRKPFAFLSYFLKQTELDYKESK